MSPRYCRLKLGFAVVAVHCIVGVGWLDDYCELYNFFQSSRISFEIFLSFFFLCAVKPWTMSVSNQEEKTDNNEDGLLDLGIPVPVQTFLWGQIAPFIRPKLGKLHEAACMVKFLFNFVNVLLSHVTSKLYNLRTRQSRSVFLSSVLFYALCP